MNRQHINTDNYEEFFLLYVDNELTPAEKASVEEFVKQHPELKSELDMYLDTKLEMDDMQFEGKEMLMRTEEGINESNIEEHQILWLDNELDPSKLAEVEAFTTAHSASKENFEWLKKAKLQEEKIVFPDKASLYRKEKKPAVVLSFAWVRIAVAAAVIIVAGLLWLNSENNNQEGTTPGIASLDDSSTKSEGQIKKTIEESSSSNNNQTIASTEEKNTGVIKQEDEQVAGTTPAHKSVTKKESVVTIATVDRNTNTTANDIAKQEIVDRASEETIAVKPVVDLPNTEEPHAKEVSAMNVKTDYVTEALYRDNGNSTDEFSADEPRQRKGLRGLVRKVNRFYNKATNPDPEKAVVKVANFEIGLPR